MRSGAMPIRRLATCTNAGRSPGADRLPVSPNDGHEDRSPDSELRGQPRETSGVTSALLLAYLDKVGGPSAVEAVLSRCGLSACEAELRDENCWFSWQTKIELFEASAAVLENPGFLTEMAGLALDLKVAGGLKVALRTLGSPQLVYRSVVRANARFNGSHAMELISIGSGHAQTRFVDISGAHRFHRLDCEYSAALLSIIPELFGLPRAQLTHLECVGDGADSCVYELRWHEHTSAGRRMLAAGLGSAAALSASAVLLPAALPAAGALALTSAAVLFGSDVRRRQRAWRQLQREAEDNADVAQRLFASLQDLVSDLQLEEVLSKVTRNAQAAVGGREFALLVREGDGFVCRSSSDLPQSSTEALEAWANGNARAFEQCVVIDDVKTVPALAPLADSSMPLCSLASAPLTFFGDSGGLLVALGTQSRTFLPRDVEVLQSFASQVAIALNNARRYHVTKTQADRDPLTGLLNHRSFHDALDRALEERDATTGTCVVLIDLDNFKRINDEDGHGGGDRLLRAAAAALGEACRRGDLAFRVGGDEFALLLAGLDEEAAAAVAMRTCAAVAALDPRLGASAGLVALGPDSRKDALLEQADQRLYAAKRGARPAPGGTSARSTLATQITVEVLVAALESHHAATAGHCVDVAELSARVAARLGAGPTERELVRQAALLHDLGKLAVPADILSKAGPLDPHEWDIVRTHPDRGAEILLRAPELESLAAAVRASHERWDGGGYPNRLAGQDIPLAARVVAACDAYDAMVSERPYSAALAPAAAIAELHECAGSQFDPDVVATLVAELSSTRLEQSAA
ncbi:MAG: diguanylate cyclase and metal dependent phosphohydrolase [Solirubrobacterales bacterium]|nr:diguanylate cyclase and metal dependent phosphohydrolase [Solirubrobacterales bacterium]